MTESHRPEGGDKYLEQCLEQLDSGSSVKTVEGLKAYQNECYEKYQCIHGIIFGAHFDTSYLEGNTHEPDTGEAETEAV